MFLKSGMDDFLSKPINTAWLHAMLDKWIPKDKWKKQDESNSVDNPEEHTPGAGGQDAALVVDGIDVGRGLGIACGSMENYIKTLNVFYKDGPQKIEEIQKCIDAKNLPLYTIYVHALKSASANIGADRLSANAKKLEEAGKNGDAAFIEAHTPFLLFEFNELLERLGIVLSDLKQSSQDDSVDMSLLQCELSALKAAVVSFDAAAIKEAEIDMQKYVGDAVVGATVEEILKNMLMGDDEMVVELIDSLVSCQT